MQIVRQKGIKRPTDTETLLGDMPQKKVSCKKYLPCTTSQAETKTQKTMVDWLTASVDELRKPGTPTASIDNSPKDEYWLSLRAIPMNFIWIGSVVPDKLFKNILEWGFDAPARQIVLWTDSRLMTREDFQSMVSLNSPEVLMKKIQEADFSKEQTCQLKVVDLADSQSFFHSGLQAAYDWIFQEHDELSRSDKVCAYVLLSDVLREFLMYEGAAVLREVGIETEGEGLIYLDTDIMYSYCKGMQDKFFNGVLFSKNNNDAFAVSHAHHSFFLSLLRDHMHRLEPLMREQTFCNALDGNTHRELFAMAGMDPYQALLDRYTRHGVHPVAIPFNQRQLLCSEGTWKDGKGLIMVRTILGNLAAP